MFYPTGEKPLGKTIICMNDSMSDIDEATSDCNEECLLECLTGWLNEKACCVECWQLKEYLKNKGLDESRIDEEMAAGAAAGAPAAGFATLGTVSGMGNPATPQNGGTNTGFYNSNLNGSGDKFTSISAGGTKLKKRGKVVNGYLDFLNKKKK
jgi:hypothetical protein